MTLTFLFIKICTAKRKQFDVGLCRLFIFYFISSFPVRYHLFSNGEKAQKATTLCYGMREVWREKLSAG